MIKCPNPECGRDDCLSRTEQVCVQAYIAQSEEVESGWDYDGESKIIWESQGREDTMTEPEFQCLACSIEFDWSKKDGPSNIQTHLCGNRECAEATHKREIENDVKITISSDNDSCFNPRRDCDNLGTMACWHRRYSLGDTQPKESPEEFLLGLKKGVVKNLYLYDHSGLTISTSPFSCPWDSGQIGIIFVSDERAREMMHWGRVSKKRRRYLHEILEEEVRIYDMYLQGEVWHYLVESKDEVVDSCGGLIGETLEETGILDHLPGFVPDALVREAWEKRR